MGFMVFANGQFLLQFLVNTELRMLVDGVMVRTNPRGILLELGRRAEGRPVGSAEILLGTGERYWAHLLRRGGVGPMDYAEEEHHILIQRGWDLPPLLLAMVGEPHSSEAAAAYWQMWDRIKALGRREE